MKTQLFSLALLATALSTQAANVALSPDGTPVRDTAGTCIQVNSISGQGACDPSDRVILLPNSEGGVGSVVVLVDGKETLINNAFGTAKVNQRGEVGTETTSEAEVKANFGSLLDQQPPAAASYTVRFVTGSASELTADSDAALAAMIADLQTRQAPEIRVIGHTDTVGSVEANDRLSKERAQSVVEILISRGISTDLLEAVGRGERELLVPTADNTDEAQNRRVEISVR